MSGDIYKNRTRIRVNGLLIEDDAILLAQIKSPVTNQLIWMPPGGGLQLSEEIAACLRREFEEETGLHITRGPLIAINELVKPPFHAVELYFKVQKSGGELTLGGDPEHADDEQLIKDLRWIPLDELKDLATAPECLPEWIHRIQDDKNLPDIIFQTNQG